MSSDRARHHLEAMERQVTVIGGPGRSGTSFAAECFRAAGIDPGGGWDESLRAGWEYAPVVEVNEALRWAIGDYPDDATARQAARDWKERLTEAISGKRLIKDPRFTFLLAVWAHAGLIARVIHLVRPVEEMIQSSQEAFGENPLRAGYHERIGYFVQHCDLHRIPRIAIRYPQVAREEGEDFATLAAEIARLGPSLEEAKIAIRKTRDMSRVRQG